MKMLHFSRQNEKWSIFKDSSQIKFISLIDFKNCKHFFYVSANIDCMYRVL